ALELSDHLIALDYLIEEVKDLRVEALIYEGSRSSNPNKRNYFLTSAFELNNGIIDTSLIDRTSEELLHQISIDTLFDVLSTRYNPEKHSDNNFTVCFVFSSNNTKNITLRNKVAVISNNITNNCNIKILTEELEFKKILIGLANPVSSIANGTIEIVKGNSTKFLQFLNKFR
ncbi:MAG: alkyl sulfatase C-terminal domain-containing protein, partial [Gammaproteobacteria bacterium]